MIVTHFDTQLSIFHERRPHQLEHVLDNSEEMTAVLVKAHMKDRDLGPTVDL